MLADFEDATVLAHTIRSARDSGASRLVVVTGHDHDRVQAVAQNEKAEVIHNEDYDSGMGRSIACGTRGTPNHDGWLIWPGDMPYVRPETARHVIGAFDPNRPVVPTFRGRRGHPVLFPSLFARQLGRLGKDRGARDLLADAIEVETDDPAILTDIDRPGDLSTAGQPGT